MVKLKLERPDVKPKAVEYRAQKSAVSITTRRVKYKQNRGGGASWMQPSMNTSTNMN